MADGRNIAKAVFNSTGGKFYVVEIDEPFERIEIQFMPSTINPARQGRYANINVVGRSNDHMEHVGGSETLSLDFDFYADSEFKDDVITKVDWLKSLTVRDAKGKTRRVKIVLGNVFRNEVWTILSVNPNYSHLDDENDFNPMRANARVVFQLDPDENITLEDIRR